MKNITVTVDDESYRVARIRAAEAGSSVSAMVAGYLRSLGGAESDFERRLRIERETLSAIHSFSAADRLPRDQVHARHAVR